LGGRKIEASRPRNAINIIALREAFIPLSLAISFIRRISLEIKVLKSPWNPYR